MSSTEGGSSRGVTSRWDPDAPENFVVPMSSSDASGSSQRRKKKRQSAHDKDSGYPPTEYTHFAYDVAIQWYKDKSVEYLESTYLRNIETGKVKLATTIENHISTALLNHPLFHNCQNDFSAEYASWLDHCVKQCIYNTTHLMTTRCKFTPELLRQPENLQFSEKMDWWAKAANRISLKARRSAVWLVDSHKKALEYNHSSTILWVPGDATIVQLGAYQVGGHGRVRKVRIHGLDSVPDYLEFAGKSPKGQNARENRIARSVEACVCPLTHPGIVKFWALNTTTMEAYTLWWNGGSLHDMLKLDGRLTQGMDIEHMKDVSYLPEDEKMRIYRYRKFRFQLAWGLVYVASLLHKTGVLHNDLSPRNILLHFSEFDPQVYIGICDWGLASLIHERSPSHYGHQDPARTAVDMRERFTVAPELFYTFGPPNSDNDLSVMQRRHFYTQESDSYSIGKLATLIVGHNEKDHSGLFKNDITRGYFVQKLADLCKCEVGNRNTCNQVVHFLMSKPFNLVPPEDVFRREV